MAAKSETKSAMERINELQREQEELNQRLSEVARVQEYLRTKRDALTNEIGKLLHEAMRSGGEKK